MLNRTKNCTFRINDLEDMYIKFYCKKKNLKRSEFFRNTVLDYIYKNITPDESALILEKYAKKNDLFADL